MQLKTSNFNKPSNKKWKLVGDILVYALIPELALLALVPETVIPAQAQVWIAIAAAEFGLISKLISKFTSEEK